MDIKKIFILVAFLNFTQNFSKQHNKKVKSDMDFISEQGYTITKAEISNLLLLDSQNVTVTYNENDLIASFTIKTKNNKPLILNKNTSNKNVQIFTFENHDDHINDVISIEIHPNFCRFSQTSSFQLKDERKKVNNSTLFHASSFSASSGSVSQTFYFHPKKEVDFDALDIEYLARKSENNPIISSTIFNVIVPLKDKADLDDGDDAKKEELEMKSLKNREKIK